MPLRAIDGAENPEPWSRVHHRLEESVWACDDRVELGLDPSKLAQFWLTRPVGEVKQAHRHALGARGK